MRVETLRAELFEPYDRFLLTQSYSLINYTRRFKDFLKELLGCGEEYLLALDGGSEVRGVLPLLFAQAGGGRVYNSLPFFGTWGGILADDYGAYRALAGAYGEIARRPSTVSATVISHPFSPFAALDAEHIAHNYGDFRIAQLTEIARGDGGCYAPLEHIDPSARRNVKKARREGVTVEIDYGQMERLREMHQENIQSVGGIPKSDDFFRLVPEHFAPGRDFDLYVARKDGRVVAGLLLFYFNRTVEYFTPAVDAEYRTFQPLPLILAEAMAEASRRGFSCWNWGGTWATQTGVYRFKKKWAAREHRYDYYTQLNDASLLGWPREKILQTFPNFYVAPFSAFNAEGKEHGG